MSNGPTTDVHWADEPARVEMLLTPQDFEAKHAALIEKARACSWDEQRCEVELADSAGGHPVLQIWPVAPRIVRLHFGPGSDRPSQLVVPGAPERCGWSIHETPGAWSISMAQGTVAVAKEPFRITVADGSGRPRLHDEPFDLDLSGRFHLLPCGYESGLWRFTAALNPDTAMFGLGEYFGPVNRRGQEIVTLVSNALGVRSQRSHKPVPLLLTTDGYAVFFDMLEPLAFDLGRNSNASWSVVARSDHLRFYVILAETLKEQLAAYHLLTGKPAVPPAWSFGLWMGRYGYRSEHEVLEVASRLRTEDIACDVIHLDPYWLENPNVPFCDFAWNLIAFPNPAEMLRRLRELGYRLSLWMTPYVPADSTAYSEAAQGGYLLKDTSGDVIELFDRRGTGGLVDFTNPAATTWFKARCKTLLDLGVAVLKTDFGEQVPTRAIGLDGTAGEALHNRYPLLYQAAVSDATADLYGYRLTWARSGYAGSQRYPVHWGGDPATTFNDMAASLRGALSWTLSGAAFASFDIGGFFGSPDRCRAPSPDLYIRWAQMGLLFSHSRVHGMAAPREPWEFGEAALAIFRRYVKLRYRLLPYIYTAAIQAQSGQPLVRPLVLDFQSDRSTHHIDDEYLLGPDLLVAPVFEADGIRELYLPAGDWYDFWTDDLHAGTRWIKRSAPLEVQPVFVRAGSVVPFGPELSFTDQPWDPIELHVYPDRQGQAWGRLEDDRRSVNFGYEGDHLVLDRAALGYSPKIRLHRG